MKQAAKLLQRNVKEEIELVKSERKRVADSLSAMPCVRRVYPSDANFLLVRVDDAPAMYNRLIEHRVIVRDRSRVPGCDNCLRITIGTPEENDRMLNIIASEK